jgi:hypothetical protein
MLELNLGMLEPTLESCPVAWQPWDLGTLEPAVGKAGLIKSLLATSGSVSKPMETPSVHIKIAGIYGCE